MKSFKNLANKYITTNKKRTITTILAIILSTAVMLSFNMIYTAQEKNTQESAKDQIGKYDVKFLELDKEQADKLSNDNRVSNVAKYKNEGALVTNLQNGIKTNFNYSRLTDEAYKNIFNFDLIQGRLPENENEILIEYTQPQYLGENIGVGSDIKFNQYSYAEATDQMQFIRMASSEEVGGIGLGEINTLLPVNSNTDEIQNSKKEVTYKVVGITRNITGRDKIYGYINDEDLLNQEKVDIYATLNNDTKIGYGGLSIGNEKFIAEDLGIKFLSKVEKNGEGTIGSQVRYANTSIVENNGQGINSGNATLIIGIVSLFMFGTIFNIFNISVLERVRHIGTLRAIGGTKDEISKIIGRESNFFCLLGIPIGVLVGVLSTKAVVAIISTFMSVSFGPSDVIIDIGDIVTVIILVFVIVKISSRFAVKKQVKMTPVEAMNTFTSESGSKVNAVGNNKFIDSKGSIETKLAHKNLYRNITRNNICTLSISVSMILFMVFTNVFVLGLENVKATTPSKNWDVQISQNNKSLSEDEINSLEKISGVEDVYRYEKLDLGIPIKKELANEELKSFYDGEEKFNGSREYKGYYGANVLIRVVSENELKLYNEYLVDGSIDYNKLNENGVLLVNSGVKQAITGTSQAGVSVMTKVSDNMVNLAVNDELKIPISANVKNEAEMKEYFEDKDINEDEFVPFKVEGILKEDAMKDTYDKKDPTEMLSDFKLVMTKECYEKNFMNPLESSIVIKTVNGDNRENTIEEIKKISNESGNTYKDYMELAEKEKVKINESLSIQIAFIIALVVIVIVNVANNFYGNIIMRKKELAAMRAIGMEHSQMKKMVLREILIMAYESCIWSLVIGGGITLFNQLSLRRLGMGRLDIWVVCIIASIIVILALSLISAWFPLNKLKGLNIVEDMKNEE